MNIIFFGSSQFAVPTLNALYSAGHNILCVVTQPDRKKGRHLLPSHTAVKDTALELNLKIIQPVNVNSRQSLGLLKRFNADLFVVVAYGQIFSEALLETPKIMPINIHASLLPKYRGAAPINWVLINGEKQSGVTIMKVTKKMDSGPLISQKVVRIEEADNALTLGQKLAKEGSSLLLCTIKDIENNDYKLSPQNDKEVTVAPKLKKNDGLISWIRSSSEINNLVRGAFGWPCAFTYYKGKVLKIHKAEVSGGAGISALRPGQIAEISRDNIAVSCGEGILAIKQLQPEGKRKMSTEEFLFGHKISVGEILG